MIDALPLAGGKSLALSHPLVMGVLNATPDSFSDGGEIEDPVTRAHRIDTMLEAGADIIDIGGESTRPGHTPVEATEEIRRVLPVIADVRDRDPDLPVSIDTQKAVVARAALEAGASLVNDVSALSDPDMPAVVSEVACAYVAMRRQALTTPLLASCRHVLDELVERAVEAGVSEGSIIIDPGLGFGRRPGPSAQDNLDLVGGIAHYSQDRPVLIGASRKRFVRSLVGEDRDAVTAGSVAVAIRAVQAGATVVRVHDVAETVAGLRAARLRPGVDAMKSDQSLRAGP